MDIQWKKVASLEEVSRNQTKKICFTDRPPILLANVDGRVYAVDDTCTHEESSLSLGCLREGMVKCTLHGSWFSVITGEPREEPADEPLQTYDVEIRNNSEVWIALPKEA